MQRALHEAQVLLQHRQVQPEGVARIGDFLLGGSGADQQVDRVADQVDGAEGQHRHQPQHDQALQQPLQQGFEHSVQDRKR
ncbi:hypothetical protein D3C72_2203400 [compost metagenome]